MTSPELTMAKPSISAASTMGNKSSISRRSSSAKRYRSYRPSCSVRFSKRPAMALMDTWGRARVFPGSPGAVPSSMGSGCVSPATIAYTLSINASKSADLRERGCSSVTGTSATMRPGDLSIIRIRSAMKAASSMLWVTISIALVGMSPSIHNSNSSPRRASALNTSRAEKGSSRQSNSGSMAMARAKLTFCLIPPDNSLG